MEIIKKIRVQAGKELFAKPFDCEIDTTEIISSRAGLFFKVGWGSANDCDENGRKLKQLGKIIHSEDGLVWKVVESAFEAEKLFDGNRMKVLSMFVK